MESYLYIRGAYLKAPVVAITAPWPSLEFEVIKRQGADRCERVIVMLLGVVHVASTQNVSAHGFFADLVVLLGLLLVVARGRIVLELLLVALLGLLCLDCDRSGLVTDQGLWLPLLHKLEVITVLVLGVVPM